MKMKLNGKNVEIPSEETLKVKDYIHLEKYNFSEFEFFKYFLKLSDEETGNIEYPSHFWSLFGKIKDIKSEIKEYPKIRKVFQRHQVASSKLEGLELAVWCLAVAEADKMDIEVIEKRFRYFMEQHYFDIINKAYHCFTFFLNGSENEPHSLKIINLFRRLFQRRSKLELKY